MKRKSALIFPIIFTIVFLFLLFTNSKIDVAVRVVGDSAKKLGDKIPVNTKVLGSQISKEAEKKVTEIEKEIKKTLKTTVIETLERKIGEIKNNIVSD